MPIAWQLVAVPYRSFVEARHTGATMKNPHEAKLHDLLASRYEVSIHQLSYPTQYIAEVHLVSKTSVQHLASFTRTEEQEARDAAYQFLKERPR